MLAGIQTPITFTPGPSLDEGNIVTDQFIRTEDRLLEGMANAVRGPCRDGHYALWLFVRQCDGQLPPRAVSAEANRKRLDALERRLSSLTLPASLRRGITGALRELRIEEPDIALALHQLVAPIQDSLGKEAADAVAAAADKVRTVSTAFADTS